MASKSGVQVNDEVVKAYNDMKLSRKYRYLAAAINDAGNEIVLEKTADRDAKYADLFKELPATPKYYVIDFDFDLGDDGSRSKLVFLYWCPDDSGVRQKMRYASSKEAMRKKLEGVVEIQANDKAWADEDYIIEKLKGTHK